MRKPWLASGIAILTAVAGFGILASCGSTSPLGDPALAYTGAQRVALAAAIPVVTGSPGNGDFFFGNSRTMKDGRILLVGHAMSHLYNPITDAWTDVDAIPTIDFPVSANLSDGRVLLAGGDDSGPNPNAVARILDPISLTWSSIPSMLTPRDANGLVGLPGGKALVVGGWTTGPTPVSSAEVFNGTTWVAAAPMSAVRTGPLAALLPDGSVLVAGGYDGSVALNSAEIYDPAGDAWTATGAMPNAKAIPTWITLGDGKIFSVGGVDSSSNNVATSETYDPSSGLWTTNPSMLSARWSPTLSLLPDGRLIAAGGYDAMNNALNTTEIFDFTTNAWTAGPSFSDGRQLHGMAVLGDGRVVVTGGRDAGANEVDSTEILDPFPTKVTLSVSGGTAPYTYALVSGRGFVAGSKFYTDRVGTNLLRATDARGRTNTFLVTVY